MLAQIVLPDLQLGRAWSQSLEWHYEGSRTALNGFPVVRVGGVIWFTIDEILWSDSVRFIFPSLLMVV